LGFWSQNKPSGNPVQVQPAIARGQRERISGDARRSWIAATAATTAASQRPTAGAGIDVTKLRFGRTIFLDKFFSLNFEQIYINKTMYTKF
jgi:hypothetical protein